MRPLLPVGRPGVGLTPEVVGIARMVAALMREYPRLTEEDIDQISLADAYLLLEHVPGILPPPPAPALEDELGAEWAAAAERCRQLHPEAHGYA